jgi:biopolymer transport protein TolR
MNYGRRRDYLASKSFSEINVTPLVDVNLPRVKSKSVDVTEEKLVLTVNGAKEIFLNKSKVTLPDLRSKLENIFAAKIDRDLFLRADRNVPYGFVVEVMSEVRKAGVDKLGMITEPPEEAR